MSEWLKEHAWKTELANDIKPLRRASTHTRSATYPSPITTPCASVNLDVFRGFEPHVSQSYHNRITHLRRVAQYASVLLNVPGLDPGSRRDCRCTTHRERGRRTRPRVATVMPTRFPDTADSSRRGALSRAGRTSGLFQFRPFEPCW
jgi:hypothetical protein